MKREEKNQQMRQRIMDSALEEFAKRGYEAGSVNAMAAAQGISKGIIYHYFKTKEDLFLACVEECFDQLTEYLKNKMEETEGGPEARLESYFSARMAFFKEHPVYQGVFCQAIIRPPAYLKGAIQARKKEFDALNILILEELFESLPLRASITKSAAIETFRQFQDFINSRSPMTEWTKEEFKVHEDQRKNVLNILLYGIVERKEDL